MSLLRRAAPGDLPVLIDLVREFSLLDGHEFRLDHALNGLSPLLQDDTLGQVWLVSPSPASPIGYAVLTWGWSLESGGRECVLDEFYLRHRGQGWGSRVLPELLDAARAAGVQVMFLETEAANGRARSLYRRHGFAIEDSIWLRQRLTGEPPGAESE